MKLVHAILDGTTVRNTNTLSLANAETGNVNWVVSGGGTAVPVQTNAVSGTGTPFSNNTAATSSPWAFPSRLNPGATGVYTITPGTTFGSGIQTFSIFLKRPAATPATTFKITLQDTTASPQVAHSVTFNWNAATSTWLPAPGVLGAVGFVDPTPYQDGWVRVYVRYQRRCTISAPAQANDAANTMTIILTPEASKLIDAWGAHLDSTTNVSLTNFNVVSLIASGTGGTVKWLYAAGGTAVTDVLVLDQSPATLTLTNTTGAPVTFSSTGPITFTSASIADAASVSFDLNIPGDYVFTWGSGASVTVHVIAAPYYQQLNFPVTPYLKGVNRQASNPILHMNTTNGALGISQDVKYKLDMTGTVTATTVVLQGRMNDAAAWTDLSTDSASKAITTIAAYPQMRICVTAYDGTAVLGSWIME